MTRRTTPTTRQMTNCNGGGQCGTCAVQVDQADGWDPRSDWEAKKLKVKEAGPCCCAQCCQVFSVYPQTEEQRIIVSCHGLIFLGSREGGKRCRNQTASQRLDL